MNSLVIKYGVIIIIANTGSLVNYNFLLLETGVAIATLAAALPMPMKPNPTAAFLLTSVTACHGVSKLDRAYWWALS